MYDTALKEVGKIFIATELGGVPARRPPEQLNDQPQCLQPAYPRWKVEKTASLILDMESNDCFVFSQHDAANRSCIDLGQHNVPSIGPSST